MNILKKKVKLVQSANMPIVLIVRNEGENPEECFLFRTQGISNNKKTGLIVEDDSFNVNYEELVFSLRTDPLNVEFTYIESVNRDQVVSKIEVSNSFVSGVRISKTYHPRRDVNQFQSGIVILNENLKLDYTSSFRFMTQPKTTIVFSFYLKQEDKYEMVSRLEPIKNWFKNKFKAIKSKLINNK
jgi:hypothetical protein